MLNNASKLAGSIVDSKWFVQFAMGNLQITKFVKWLDYFGSIVHIRMFEFLMKCEYFSTYLNVVRNVFDFLHWNGTVNWMFRSGDLALIPIICWQTIEKWWKLCDFYCGNVECLLKTVACAEPHTFTQAPQMIRCSIIQTEITRIIKCVAARRYRIRCLDSFGVWVWRCILVFCFCQMLSTVAAYTDACTHMCGHPQTCCHAELSMCMWQMPTSISICCYHLIQAAQMISLCVCVFVCVAKEGNSISESEKRQAFRLRRWDSTNTERVSIKDWMLLKIAENIN